MKELTRFDVKKMVAKILKLLLLSCAFLLPIMELKNKKAIVNVSA